jgi:hypothetical protein
MPAITTAPSTDVPLDARQDLDQIVRLKRREVDPGAAESSVQPQ